MLIETHGGFDFTGADCKRWMKESGFKRMKVEPLIGPDSMVAPKIKTPELARV